MDLSICGDFSTHLPHQNRRVPVASENTNHTRREEILQATLEAIDECKISGAHLRDIASRAGISQGHLHYYYPSKQELFLDLLDYLLECFVEERRDVMLNGGVKPLPKLSFFLKQEIDVIQRKRDMNVFYDFWVQGTRDPAIRTKIQGLYGRWREDIRAVVDEGVKAGVFSPRHADLIPSLLVSLMEGAALQYLIDEEAFDLEVYFAAAQDMVLKLLTEP
jgi:TetR/AcrR family transcriptional regulator